MNLFTGSASIDLPMPTLVIGRQREVFQFDDAQQGSFHHAART